MSRYSNVAARIWHDEKFRELPDNSKTLFIYLITSPHGNMCGLFYLPALYACHDLGWTESKYTSAMKQLEKMGLIMTDNDIVLIKNFLRYNPIHGPKQAVGAANRLNEVPHTHLVGYFMENLKGILNADTYSVFEKALIIPHQYPMDTLSDTASIPESDTDTDTDTETDTETERKKTPAPKKNKYGEFVALTDDEMAKLTGDYGPDGAARLVTILDNYKGSTGKKYKSDYRAILSWVVDRYSEEQSRAPTRAQYPVQGGTWAERRKNWQEEVMASVEFEEAEQ